MIVCRTLGPVEVTWTKATSPPASCSGRRTSRCWCTSRARLVGAGPADHLMGSPVGGQTPVARAALAQRGDARDPTVARGVERGLRSAQQIRLAAEAIHLDVEQLEQHLAEREWCAAARLVAGEFMEGFAVPEASGFEDWLTAERTLWRRRSVEALVRCAEELLAVWVGPRCGRVGRARDRDSGSDDPTSLSRALDPESRARRGASGGARAPTRHSRGRWRTSWTPGRRPRPRCSRSG